MEVFLLLILILFYFELNSKIKMILNNQNKSNKKDYSLLKKLVGRQIEIDTDDEYELAFGSKKRGILKDFNDTWIILETQNKEKKETIYYRLINIKSIVTITRFIIFLYIENIYQILLLKDIIQ